MSSTSTTSRTLECSAISHGAIRVWRVRKDHAWLDAQLSGDDAAGVRVEIFYDGDRIFSRTYRSRELAIADAADKLRELQRAGWNTHW